MMIAITAMIGTVPFSDSKRSLQVADSLAPAPSDGNILTRATITTA